MKYNTSGSLTLYVQSTPPKGGKMGNWLPDPKEAFSLYKMLLAGRTSIE